MTATPERYEAVAEEYLRTEIYYNDIRIRSSVAVTIDGKPGYAITAEGTQTDTHTKDLIYLVVLYKNDGACQFAFAVPGIRRSLNDGSDRPVQCTLGQC